MKRVCGILAHLDARGVAAAVIGGTALAIHGVARATIDVDLYTGDARVLDAGFWSEFQNAPRPEISRGDAADPLAGVVRWNASDPVDLIVGRGRLASEIVSRRVFVELEGSRLPVVEAPDLIVLKLMAGGPQDLLDVRLLLNAQPGWRATVDDRISAAGGDARESWKRIDPI